MKYAMLVHYQPGYTDLLSEDESKAMLGEYIALRDAPGYISSGELQPVETATTVRVQDGQTLITDGPYADTKEVFGGYYVFEATNLDEAIELALRNTSQQLGGAIGIAIASSLAASHTQTLLHAGKPAPAALTGGFEQALWALGAIALLAVPAIFALVRREELSDAVTKTTIREAQPALAGAN